MNQLGYEPNPAQLVLAFQSRWSVKDEGRAKSLTDGRPADMEWRRAELRKAAGELLHALADEDARRAATSTRRKEVDGRARSGDVVAEAGRT
jgi:hypothetical protein